MSSDGSHERLYDAEASALKEYVFYVGEPVGTVGLWKRYDDLAEDMPPQYTQEYPIWQNTRGRGIWNASKADTTTADCSIPSDGFWNALQQIATGEPDDPIDVDCAWYEAEVIQSVIDVAISMEPEELPTEIGELLAYAKGRE